MTIHIPNLKPATQPNTNLYDILFHNAQLNPNKIYYYNQKSTITYNQMCQQSMQLAQQLHHHLQFSPKPILAVSTTNSQTILHLTWACLAAGICLAFLPPSHDPVQIRDLMAQIQARRLVTDTPELQTQAWVLPYEKLSYQQSGSSHLNTLVAVPPETPAFIFQTSGTTGAAKWIQVNHSQFVAAIECMKSEGALVHAVNQVAYITPPLSHSYGLSSLLEYTAVGASVILPQGASILGAINGLINSHLTSIVTTIEGVLHFYTQLTRLMKRINLPALQHVGFGGGKLNQDIIRRISKTYPKLSYSVRYGMTETPSVVSHKLFRYPYKDNWASSGKILPIYNLQIVDQAGQAVSDGQQGEIHIKGSSLAWPYYGETAVTNFFATGDIGFINDDKELCIIGRKSSYLKVRGYRISPEYIESMINTFDGILECRVSGTDVGILAEVVSANRALSRQTLLAFLTTKLPSYAIPDTVTLVEAIPRTSSGKIKRY